MKILAYVILLLSIQGYGMVMLDPLRCRALYRSRARRTVNYFMAQETLITIIEVTLLGRVVGWW